jgi:NADPH2:quinone reductase
MRRDPLVDECATSPSRRAEAAGLSALIVDHVDLRSYSMAEIVEAHRYVDSGHKVGNVVITVVDD